MLRRHYRATRPGENVHPLSLPEIFARLRRLEAGAMEGVTLPKLSQALLAAGRRRCTRTTILNLQGKNLTSLLQKSNSSNISINFALAS